MRGIGSRISIFTGLGLGLGLALVGCGAGPANPSAVPPDSKAQTNAADGVVPDVVNPVVGSMAPAFELAGSDGKTHKLADYFGEHVVLAFFPKAFTSG